MSLPIKFEQFLKHPIAAVAFCMLLAVGYLFYELRDSYNNQLKDQNIRIEKLEEKIEEYEDKLEKMNQKFLECITASQNS
jgi:uncharacterized membrane-anchored protein YhcB (DUF1043 family)